MFGEKNETALISEISVIQAESQLNQKERLIISQTVEILKPFKTYTEMFLSDEANLALVISMIHIAHEDMASFLEQTAGCADILPEVWALVKRLQG